MSCLTTLLLLAAPPGTWNVQAAGAIADGRTDCTAIFQRLLDEAGAAGGGIVEVPAGRYRLDGTLSVPANTTLEGIYRVAPTCGPVPLDQLTGTVLYAYAGRGAPDGPPFINLAGHNSAVRGMIIAYPEWSTAQVPPIPYPPCIGSTDTENVSVTECLLLNPYEAIKLVRAHRHLIRNVNGYPIMRGLFVDQCYDIGKVENIHFWPFGTIYRPDDPYNEWINTQGVAFEFARTDWEYVHNTFCFGYGVGYKFSAYEHGAANGNFLGLGADSCERAVLVEQAQMPGLLITNGEFVGRWSSTAAVCIEIADGCEGKVSLSNCSFWGPIDRCVWMRSAVGSFAAVGCHFVNWDNRGVGSPAIQLDAGRALVQGCTFVEDALHVQAGAQVASAILTGNQAAGGFRVDNAAGARTQQGFNEQDPIEWTAERLRHYRIVVGGPGDGRYLRGFHGRERVANPVRWSMPGSTLNLPIPRGVPVTITIVAEIPAHARADDAGLYLGDTRLAALPAAGPIVAELPAQEADRVRLELRCAGWVPQAHNPDSRDPRTLGLMLSTITVRAAGGGETPFDANEGTP